MERFECLVVVTVLVFFAQHIQDVISKSFDLTIQPEHAQIGYRGSVKIMCQADVPLTRCQFRLHHIHASLPLIDLSQGPQSATADPVGGDRKLKYKPQYHGTGLKDGQCGVTLTKVIWGRFYATCRARADKGGWEYASMTFSAANKSTFNMTVFPKSAVVLPGRDHSILCQSGAPLVECYADVPTSRQVEVFFNQGPQSPATPHYRYHGAGLPQGQCGLTVLGAGEPDNGVTWCSGTQAGQRGAARGSVVIVAVPPSDPELTLPGGSSYSVGDSLTATCRVQGGRPAPSVTWLLGNLVVRQDTTDDVPGEEWAWPWDRQTITQRLVIKVTSQFHGKDLVCSVGHEALTAPRQSKMTLSVRGAGTAGGVSTSCPPLSEPSLELSCHLEGVSVNCLEPMAVGTIANMKCAEGYIYGTYPGYKIVACTATTTWSKPLYKCIPDCGKKNSVGVQLLISGGDQAEVGEFSWHAGIYRRNTKALYEQICGGTLISATPTILVSAAHCFWDEAKAKAMDKSLYKVVAGKYYRDFYINDEESQTRDVAEILVHDRYLGRRRNLAFDIAIVRLSQDVKLTQYINVICMDWQGDLEDSHLVAGNNGTVAGWGATSDQISSPVLMSVQLPFVPFKTCQDTVSADFQKFLAPDKICAGWRNKGTSVCPGDSGGGYVFPQDTSRGKRYYFRGIVSAGHILAGSRDKTCNTQQLAAFTLVSVYRSWLENYVFGSETVAT